jgi:hypothetical protein
VELGHRPLRASVAYAAAGLGLVTLASVVAALLDAGQPSLGVPRLDALRAGLESIAIVSPALLIASLYLGLRMALRTIIAGLALGLLTGGFVAASLIPLMAFLSLVERTDAGLQFAMSPLVPTVALISISVVVLRIMSTLDPSRTSMWVGRLFVVLVFSVFAFRFLSHSTFFVLP